MKMIYGILRKNKSVQRLEGEELEEAVGACSGRHKCKACTYDTFVHCPKVMDGVKKSISVQSNYSFIRYALEVYDHHGHLAQFIVVDCENFRSERQRSAKDRAETARNREDFRQNKRKMIDFYLDKG